MSRERRVWCHYCVDGWKWKIPVHGRWWIHVFAWTFCIEWTLLKFNTAIRFEVNPDDDHQITTNVAVPGLGFYFCVDLPWPMNKRLHRLMADGGRQFQIYFFHWQLVIHPWCRVDEWRRSDPWWRRGLTIDFKDLVLGDQKSTCEEVKPPEPVAIEFQGHTYLGEATFERRVWKRPRWFALERTGTWISMKPGHGLPHAGKGTAAHNCGDDALCGWGVNGIDVAGAIAHGIKTADESRARYGRPSVEGPQAVIGILEEPTVAK